MHKRPNESREDRAVRLAASCCSMLDLDPPVKLCDALERLRTLQTGFEILRRRESRSAKLGREDYKKMAADLEKRKAYIESLLPEAKKKVDEAKARRDEVFKTPPPPRRPVKSCWDSPDITPYDIVTSELRRATEEYDRLCSELENLCSDIEQMQKNA